MHTQTMHVFMCGWENIKGERWSSYMRLDLVCQIIVSVSVEKSKTSDAYNTMIMLFTHPLYIWLAVIKVYK